MIKVLKIKGLLILLLATTLSLTISLGLYKIVQASTAPKIDYTIVIDAGHGGRDAGTSGVNTGAKESDLSLAISKKLQKYLCDFGFNVVMTRTTTNGLYSENVNNFKKDDMAKREQIIAKAKANMLISIHLNSFTSPSEKGAQAFFDSNNELSKHLSASIQDQMISNLQNARSHSNSGDYYLLNQFNTIPTSLIECGFLSNPDEEILLISDEYQQKIAYSIFSGIISYLCSVYGAEKSS